jgi:MFS family permease
LFEFSQLRHQAFRYGLLTSVILAMGQFGLIFALPIFLQDAKHLSAQTNGLWMLPMGIFIIMGAQIGGRLTRKVGVTPVVRMGLALETVGLALLAFSITPNVSFWALLRAFILFGFGVGFASSQLTNVVLYDIDREKSGVASGANTTVRQLGGGLGAAAIGSFLTAQTVHQAIRVVTATKQLPATIQKQAIAQLHVLGPNYQPPANIDSGSADVLRRALAVAISRGTRPALFFASGLVLLGSIVSFLIPRIGPPGANEQMEVVDTFEAFEPIDPDPAVIDQSF